MSIAKRHIFFVDEEPKIRAIVGETLEGVGFKVSCFASAMDCLKELRSQRCDLLITDVRMPEMDGIELLREAKRIAPWLRVLLVTGYGDVPMTVAAFKTGAVDLIEKPLDRETLLSAIESVLKQITPVEPLLGESLTKTEMRVLSLLMDSKGNKGIARLLRRSVRTIETHRCRIMRKFGVDNLLDLFKRATAMGLVKPRVK